MSAPDEQFNSAFRVVPRTGVIFVMTEAARRGYSADHPAWANLGQGQPEAGALPSAPPRVDSVEVGGDPEYGPVAGIWALREAVADLYNTLYRRGRGSKYSAENVCICPGGRAALTRAAAAIGHINMGHFLPDYTAYEELLDIFRTFTPIPILLEPSRGYAFDVDALRTEILGRGLAALLLSNPCNPTGKLIYGSELQGWVDTARELDCTLLLDEFYSNFVWVDTGETPPTVSAAAHVRDVDKDPVVLFNGLTKNWRYPGWRIAWAVGPKPIIDGLASAGSFLDGGANRPLQHAALPLLDAEHVRRESAAIQQVFAPKRQTLIDGLQQLGIGVDRQPEGSFYVWGDLSQLPSPLDDGMELFKRALSHQVILVPGEFFDVNPGQRRPVYGSRFRGYARFSFGAQAESVHRGLNNLQATIDSVRQAVSSSA